MLNTSPINLTVSPPLSNDLQATDSGSGANVPHQYPGGTGSPTEGASSRSSPTFTSPLGSFNLQQSHNLLHSYPSLSTSNGRKRLLRANGHGGSRHSEHFYQSNSAATHPHTMPAIADLSPHSAQLQLAIERSFMQQLNTDNRALHEKLSQSEYRIQNLQEQLELSEKAKVRYKTQAYASKFSTTSIEGKVRALSQEKASGVVELKQLRQEFRNMEIDLERQISTLNSRVKELESILEATKTSQLRDRYQHEMQYERLKAQVDMEKHKNVMLTRQSVEQSLDVSIHEKNRGVIADKNKRIKQLKAQLRLVESENADHQDQIKSLAMQNKKMRSKLKNLEKKVIPTMKQEIDRQTKYIALMQKDKGPSTSLVLQQLHGNGGASEDPTLRDRKKGPLASKQSSNSFQPFQEKKTTSRNSSDTNGTTPGDAPPITEDGKKSDQQRLPPNPLPHADTGGSQLSIDSLMQDFQDFKSPTGRPKKDSSSGGSGKTTGRSLSPARKRSDIQQRFKDVQRYVKQEEDIAKMDDSSRSAVRGGGDGIESRSSERRHAV
mmetsp:Transcript_9926/g.37008  ORF Transcript_9926/g.37008 Transcript_9926/m.37008 type:complete len:549 (-) Transcript_9926:136-1782(-)|eukprot:CAMPEP_0117443144 /NCGR_PEP_ID=MMETSP0759-20121206/4539_1 /TAXON_ID=63605 /ORGANISM="Percolomonas cosmopolitus, Strain WS" /LENGTH=548 /DNA_ID=CAMNT_0005235101 /DNA_START=459 /DNA_END=2105 /DNA_ORIENTATION=+